VSLKLSSFSDFSLCVVAIKRVRDSVFAECEKVRRNEITKAFRTLDSRAHEGDCFSVRGGERGGGEGVGGEGKRKFLM
jgi:hypothetical protein